MRMANAISFLTCSVAFLCRALLGGADGWLRQETGDTSVLRSVMSKPFLMPSMIKLQSGSFPNSSSQGDKERPGRGWTTMSSFFFVRWSATGLLSLHPGTMHWCLNQQFVYLQYSSGGFSIHCVTAINEF